MAIQKGTVIRIPDATVKSLSGSIHRVWQIIGNDVAGEDGEVSNACAIECSIDADRIAMYVSPEAQAELRAAIDAYGYDALFRKLCRSIRLA